MKNTFLALIMLLLSIVKLPAQKIELYGAYSLGSEIGKVPDITVPYDNKLCATMVFDAPDRQKSAMTLGANVKIWNHISVGVSWTGLNTYTQPVHYHNNKEIHHIKYSSNTLLFNIKYEWLKLSKFHFYSKGGIGAVFFSKPERSSYFHEYPNHFDWGKDDDRRTRLAWQISYLGIDFRPIRWLGIFAEGGFGRQGALTAGLKVFM